jgi:endonuclease/exonuclease/phosphatase family metal-dependent hydrolase
LFRKFLHNLSVIINLSFVILLLIADLSVFISPEKLWIAAFMGLAYPYLLLINVCFIIYWIIKRQKLFLISIAAILIGWNNLSAFIQLPLKPANSKEKSKKTTLKVMTYNVRAFNKYKWIRNNNSYYQIVQLVKNDNPDVICFQEFYEKGKSEHSVDNIFKLLQPHKYYFASYSYNERKPSNFGIATFSKYPIVNKGKLSFKQTHNISMYCDIKVNKDTIRIYNNHLQTIQFIKGNYDFLDSLNLTYDEHKISEIKDISYRLRDAYVLRAHQVNHISEHIGNSPYPVIVCGDFNDTPVSYTYHKMKEKLKDAFRGSGIGIGNTYTGKFPSFRIDYILYNDQFRSFGFQTIKKELSDHYPVSCSLVLK